MPSFQVMIVSLEVHVWLAALMTLSTPLLSSRQAVIVPSEAVKLPAATAAPLAATSSARSAMAGVGLGILPHTVPTIVLILPLTTPYGALWGGGR
jgi:hypothetical protein